MLILEKPQVTEKKLVLADYVSIHSPGPGKDDTHSIDPCAVVVSREEFFQRIQKQRGALVPPVQKQGGDLIDVRLRAAAAKKRRWKQSSEIATSEDKVVA